MQPLQRFSQKHSDCSLEGLILQLQSDCLQEFAESDSAYSKSFVGV